MEQSHSFSSLQIFCTQKSFARQITNTDSQTLKRGIGLVGIIRVETILVGSEIRRGLGLGKTSIGLGETLHGRNSLWAKPAASVSNGCIDRTIQAYRFKSWAFVRKPLAGSSRHLSQKRNSSFFSSDGFLPFKEESGISLSERTTDIVSLVSFDDLQVLPQNASIPCLAARSSQVGGHL